ncbi:MAG: M23 family metallopeptidase, partial [Bacteroidota bacterium]
RKHEGNDIFADHGTPLLAVTDGRLTSTRSSNLGGKTVWLDDDEGRPLRYYYAHLDKRLVSEGDYVKRGEPVGLVGNTGNAVNTPPHLHFGIYVDGAIDPFNFLNDPDKLPAYPNVKIKGKTKKVPSKGKYFLRTSPNKDGKILSLLQSGERITLLGSTANFYRVRTSSGELGYVKFD